jgi:hypothetical protein
MAFHNSLFPRIFGLASVLALLTCSSAQVPAASRRVSGGPKVAQQTEPQLPPPLGPPTRPRDEDEIKREREQEKARNKERQQSLQKDTEKLLQLATELKESVDKSNENTLSLDVIRKAEEVEKLAHRVKEKMRSN